MSSSPGIPAAELAALIAGVKQLFATSFIGFSVATTLYGISVLQIYLYYRNYPGDRASLKFMVALLLSVLRANSLNRHRFTTVPQPSRYLVYNIRRPFIIHLLRSQLWQESARRPSHSLEFFSQEICQSPGPILIQPDLTDREAARYIDHLCGSTVLRAHHLESHCQQNHRGSHHFSGRHLFGVGNSHNGGTLYHCISDWNSKILGSINISRHFNCFFYTTRPQIISGLVQGLAALNDVIITVSMCYYLYHNRGGLPSTNRFVDTLILYAVSRGVLTAVCQILFLATNVALPGATYWQPFHQAVGKLYVNSVYATLNVRSTFSEKSEVQLGTVPVFKMTNEREPTSGEISVESSGFPKPITFAHTRVTDTTGTDSSALDTSSGGDEKAQ